MEHHVLDGLLHCRAHDGGRGGNKRIVLGEVAGFALPDGERDAAAEDGSRLQPEPGVRWRRRADDEPDGDDRSGEGARHGNRRAAGRNRGLGAAVDGDERGRLAVHQDRDLPAECHPGAGPRGASPVLGGGARRGQREGGAVTVRVGDRGQRDQQRVGPGIRAAGQRDQVTAPRDEARAGQRDALGDVHEAHLPVKEADWAEVTPGVKNPEAAAA